MKELIMAFIQMITSGLNLGNKLAPTDKMKEDKDAREKPRKEGMELIAIYDREYRRLKDHEEIDIAKDVNFVNDNMPDDQQQEMIENLTNRIFEYRRKKPVRFKRFLQTKKFLDWDAKQIEKNNT